MTMKLAEHVARIGVMGNTCNAWVRKPEKRPLGRYTHKSEDYIKKNIIKKQSVIVSRFICLRKGSCGELL